MRVNTSQYLNIRGKAVQVDPIKSTLKAPGTQALRLRYDQLLSTFALKLNSRRYTAASSPAAE
jgi:hypothetical protein